MPNTARRPLFSCQQVGQVYAAAVLAGLPLFMYNGYYGLVTGKAWLFYLLTGAAALAWVVAKALAAGAGQPWRPVRAADRGLWALWGLCALYAVNTPLAAQPRVAFFGLPGRHNGLLMLLCCAVGYTLVFFSVPPRCLRRLCHVFQAACCLAAALGWLNFFLYDPLDAQFSAPADQRHMYLSTVGNTNFFGALMAIGGAVALYACVYSATVRGRWLHGAAATLVCSALLCAGSDGAWLALAAVLALLLCGRGRSWAQAARVLAVGAGVCGAALAVGLLQRALPTLAPLRTLSALLCRPGVAAGGVAACGAAALWLRRRDGGCARVFRALGLAATAVATAAVLAVNLGGVDAGALDGLLRFGPGWGSNRGYVWGRLLYVFGDELTWWQWLIGVGGDGVNALLNPHYTKYLLAMNGASFDSAHNLLLQQLICGGVVGVALLCAFWAQRLRTAARGQAALGPGAPYYGAVLAALTAYCVQAFFSIDMPAILPPVLLLGAMAGAPAPRPLLGQE